ncbi:MAG TPA: hypothetical protein VF821_04495 [Lentzea sp.]
MTWFWYIAGAIGTWFIVLFTLRAWGRGRLKGYTGPGLPVVIVLFYVLALKQVMWVVFDLGAPLEEKTPDILKMALMWGFIATGMAVLGLAVTVFVLVLPNRHHNRSGPTGRRVPWRVIGWSVLVVELALAGLTLVVADAVNALRFALGGLALAYLCFLAAKRGERFEADRDWRPADGEPFVLYIRGFRSENRYFAPTPAGFRRPRTYWPIDIIMARSSSGLVRFDEFLRAPLLARVGPLTGLGSPTDFLPPDGARRVYRTTENWRMSFQDMVLRSEFIVTDPGIWQYLEVELKCIAEVGAQSKLMICTEPVMSRGTRRYRDFSNWEIGARRETWGAFSAAVWKAGYVLPPDPGPGSVVAFASELEPVVVATSLVTPQDYVDAIVRHLRNRPKDLIHTGGTG